MVLYMLILRDFSAGIEAKEILHGINLQIKPGEIHAVMGPKGSGKTTLAMSLMGNPNYNVKFPASQRLASTLARGEQMSNFKCQIDGKDFIKITPEERARHGLFVSFQSPIEITGVSFLAFLRTAAKAIRPD